MMHPEPVEPVGPVTGRELDGAPVRRAYRWRHGRFDISTDPALVDLDVVHGFLTTCYWASGISRSKVERSIAGSVPFGLYGPDGQVGFARVITDGVTFAYLADVFVLESHRALGLGRWLVGSVLAHPELQGLRRWLLATRDAHSLYSRYDFVPVAHERWMERRAGAAPDVGGSAQGARADASTSSDGARGGHR